MWKFVPARQQRESEKEREIYFLVANQEEYRKEHPNKGAEKQYRYDNLIFLFYEKTYKFKKSSLQYRKS